MNNDKLNQDSQQNGLIDCLKHSLVPMSHWSAAYKLYAEKAKKLSCSSKAHSVFPNLLNKPFPASNSRSIAASAFAHFRFCLPAQFSVPPRKTMMRRDVHCRAFPERASHLVLSCDSDRALREAEVGLTAQQAIVCTIRLLSLPPRPSDFRIPL